MRIKLKTGGKTALIFFIFIHVLNVIKYTQHFFSYLNAFYLIYIILTTLSLFNRMYMYIYKIV